MGGASPVEHATSGTKPGEKAVNIRTVEGTGSYGLERKLTCDAGGTTAEYALLLLVVVLSLVVVVMSVGVATARLGDKGSTLSNTMPATYYEAPQPEN